MPEVNSKLVSGLRQAKASPMYFAFVAKGANDGALIVAKKKVPNSEINEAKISSGGKLVFKGRCQGEGAKMIFEVPKEPPGTLAKQVKSVISRDAGMNLQVEFRIAADLEESGEEDTQVQAPQKEAAPKQVDAPLDPAAPPPPPKAPPPPPRAPAVSAKSPPPATDATLEKEWERLMIALESKVIRAEKAKEPDAKKWRKMYEAAGNMGSDGQFAQAIADLNNLDALMNPAFAAARQEYEAAARAARMLMAQLNEDDGSAVRDYLDEAKATLDKPKKTLQDFTDATAKLDELKATLQAELPHVYQEANSKIQTPPPPASGEAQAVANVACTQARLRWDSTRKDIQAELQATEKKILDYCRSFNENSDSNEKYDLAEAATKVKEIYTLLDKLDERLIDKLDEALNAADAKRKTHQQEATKIIDEYKGIVNTDPILAAMAKSQLAPSKLKETLLGVLNDLSGKL